MKKYMLNGLKFCCMVLILGAQTLLHGSWSVSNDKSPKTSENR